MYFNNWCERKEKYACRHTHTLPLPPQIQGSEITKKAMGKNDKEPKLITMELKVSVMLEMNHFGGNGCLKAETKCLLITLEIKCLYVQKIYDKDIFELVIF